jgi:hypothetical protein
MLNLKQDNERLQRIVTSKSLTSSQSSLPITDSLERRFSMTETSAPPSTGVSFDDNLFYREDSLCFHIHVSVPSY